MIDNKRLEGWKKKIADENMIAGSSFSGKDDAYGNILVTVGVRGFWVTHSSGDANYPGVITDFHADEVIENQKLFDNVALSNPEVYIEQSKDSKKSTNTVRIWGDELQEDYTDKVELKTFDNVIDDGKHSIITRSDGSVYLVANGDDTVYPVRLSKIYSVSKGDYPVISADDGDIIIKAVSGFEHDYYDVLKFINKEDRAEAFARDVFKDVILHA